MGSFFSKPNNSKKLREMYLRNTCVKCFKPLDKKDLRYATKEGDICIPCDKDINKWRYIFSN